MIVHRRFIALSVVPLMSCGSSAPTALGDDTGVAVEDTAPTEDVAQKACGTNVGDILCDLPLEGYIRDGVATGLSTEAPYASAKLSELVAQGTQKYAFVWTSAYWCAPCRSATSSVASEYASLMGKAMFVNVLVEGTTPDNPATKGQVGQWASYLKLPFAVIRDPDGAQFNAKKTLGAKLNTYIVERTTMKIVVKGEPPSITEREMIPKLKALPD